MRSQAADADIAVDAPELFPESMAYLAATQRFYVGSVRYGRVSSVGFDGTIATLVDDPSLHSTFGIVADEKRGTILACSADIGLSVRSTTADTTRICKVLTIDARSGEIVRTVDLIASTPGKHLPNDAAIAADGSVYVTDTLSPIVFRISPTGEPGTFVTDVRFAPPDGPGGAGLDGIAIAASGTIVVNHISGGNLFRIDPSTKAVTRVVVDGGVLLKGCDGMRFERDGRLIVVQGTLVGPSRNALCTLESADDWKTATVSRVRPLSATTYQSVRTNTGVYGVQGRLEDLFRDPKNVNVPGFSITRIAD